RIYTEPLLLGYRKVEELVFQERIQVTKEYEETLSSILPQQQPILNDYF
ncbi:sterol carrier protein domain-containing protein, partial [Enterococcus faecium]